jgi:hypothetical protein
MTNDMRPPGDAEANRKTRLVMRPDIAEAGTTTGEPPRGGAVIGTTRLIGNIAQAAPNSATAAPNVKALARTQFVRQGIVDTEPVAGWVVVIKGPGRGGFRPVYVGMNSLGRAPSQRIPLDFGDENISREEHAFITYDDETRTFYLHHGGKSNLVRLGGKPVLAPTELKSGDLFRIGNTTFRFVAFCGSDFDWTSEVDDA